MKWTNMMHMKCLFLGFFFQIEWNISADDTKYLNEKDTFWLFHVRGVCVCVLSFSARETLIFWIHTMDTF